MSAPLTTGDYLAELRKLESRGWTTIYSQWRGDNGSNSGSYCAIALPSLRDKALRDPGWDLLVTDGRPSFTSGQMNGEYQILFDRGPLLGEIEPLVLIRDFMGLAPAHLELSQEFRLFHNLYWNAKANSYMLPEQDGTLTEAVRFTDNEKVAVKTKLLRMYQSARQVDLILFYDSVHFYDEVPSAVQEQRWDDETICAALMVGDHKINGKNFTHFLGKLVVPAPPVEKSGIPPYDQEDADAFPHFLIGVSDDGEEQTFTCNPDKLANNFGANPEAPNYLTPIAFRKEVLQKYYENPEVFSVTDGHVWCGTAWVLRIDNHASDYARVFLGDLGRDLPRKEREYWRTFNVASDAGLSDTIYRRAFLAEWAETDAPDLLFRSKYRTLSQSWYQATGWSIYLDPEPADKSMLRRLRIPLNDSLPEFETAIALMVKLLVDSLNESAISGALGSKVLDEKGIAKFGRLLKEAEYPVVERDIQFLRALQELRSTGTAHRKGSRYQKTLEKHVGEKRGREAIEILFASANAMLTELNEWVGDSALQIRKF